MNKEYNGDDYHELVTCADDFMEYGQRLSEIAASFIGLRPEETDDAIADALNEVGILFKLDQVCVRIMDKRDPYLSTLFRRKCPEVCARCDLKGVCRVSSSSWLMKRVTNQATVIIESLDEVPEEASGIRRLMESRDVVSAIIVPLVWRTTVEGFLCVGSLSSVRRWKSGEKVWLELLASTIAGALGHKETETTLRSTQARLTAGNMALEERVRERTLSLEKTLADLKDAQRLIIQQEKLSSIGQLAAGIAHEINNPTGFIMSNLHIFRDYYNSLTSIVSEYDLLHSFGSPDAVRTREALSRIGELKKGIDFDFMIKDAPNLLEESLAGTDRIKGIVLALQNYARSSETDKQPVMLEELLDRALKLAGNELKYRLTIQKNYTKVPSTLACENQILQVFLNLLLNAAQSMPGEGSLFLSTGATDTEISISIRDTGVGIPPENLSKIMDPFFTTKPAGQGTGLGLSIVHRILDDHGGRLDVASSIGVGSTFTVTLPIIEEENPAL